MLKPLKKTGGKKGGGVGQKEGGDALKHCCHVEVQDGLMEDCGEEGEESCRGRLAFPFSSLHDHVQVRTGELSSVEEVHWNKRGGTEEAISPGGLAADP